METKSGMSSPLTELSSEDEVVVEQPFLGTFDVEELKAALVRIFLHHIVRKPS